MKKSVKISYLVIAFSVLLSLNTTAQYSRHIIQLKDKKGTLYTLSNPSAYLSSKAIERRNRQHIVIDSTDLPISKAYLDSISAIPNVIIFNKSKWLNQVLIATTDPAALAKINSFTFVKSSSAIAARLMETNRVSTVSKNKLEEKSYGNTITSNANRITGFLETTDLNYGGSFQQIHIHEGDYMPGKDFTGNGITIAVLDGGFNSYKTNPAFDSVRLQNRFLGEWDFVNRESSVNEDDSHGSYCLSVIASNIPGTIVGSAPSAKFWLFRTEDVYTEYPVEEQNWAAAAEMADSVGADMISTSLGYSDFDDAAFNHSYLQRNGNTAISTIAADFAAKKGMIVTVSAGNSGSLGNDLKFVSCPADADSVLTVGATTTSGVIADFSSWGPNGAGKVKPNVVTVGQGTICAAPDGTVVALNGTSLANPNMAGLVACLWQAFPEFTNMEIIDAIQKSSHKYSSPDGRYGYGIPNFRTAFGILEKERLIRSYSTVLGSNRLKVFPTIFNTTLNILINPSATGPSNLAMYDINGHLIEKKSISVNSNQIQLINLNRIPQLPSGVYFIRYIGGNESQTIKVVKQ
jgi:serine protease AprX